MDEYVYCAVNKDGKIINMRGSSTTRYFKTDRYLKQFVARGNMFHSANQLRIGKFKLVEVEYEP